MKANHHRFLAATAAFLVTLTAVVILSARSAASPAPVREDQSALAAQLRNLARRSLRGEAEATFEFARRVEFGIGTEPDPDKAAYWYEVAEEQGYTLPADVISRLFL